MNRLSSILSGYASKSTTYDFASLFQSIESAGFSPRRKGREIKLNADGDVYVLNPGKGVWTGSSGSGTISRLLHSLRVGSALPLAVRTEDDETRTSQENKERIARKIKNSVVVSEITGESSGSARLLKKIVEDYLAGRGLSADLLPDEARIRKDEKGFYELIVPLLSDGDALSVHITALDSTGKHQLAWLGGDSRYSMGPNAGAFAVIDGATERLEIKGKEGINWFCIGEGLENVMSMRLLTEWTAIFAVSAVNLPKILTSGMVGKLREHSGGLAIAVDRDESGCGQKQAAVLAKNAKEAGIPVLFLVPPSIVKGGEKGADWNDSIKELGRDGAMGALKVAIARSEQEFSSVEIGKSAVSLDFVQASDHEPVRYNRVAVDEAASQMYSFLKNRFHEKSSTPELHAFPMGLGKSSLAADLARDNALAGRLGVRLIAPTKALAYEFAINSGGMAREGRSGEEDAVGRCEIFPDVIPFSAAWRSAVAHKCTSCVHGKAAMSITNAYSHPKLPLFRMKVATQPQQNCHP